MSKRFGRNQRRRAREQIAKLEAECVTMSKGMASAASDAIRSRNQAAKERARAALLQCQIDAARSVLGDSIALPPIEQVLDGKTFACYEALGNYRLRRQRRWNDDMGITAFDSLTPEMRMAKDTMLSVEIETVDVIEAGIALDGIRQGGELWRQPHAYLRCNGPSGERAYAVRLPDLARINDREAVRRIADLLADNMVKDLARAFR